MHDPGSEEEREAARTRLAFQELLALQLKLLVQRNMAWRVEGAELGRVLSVLGTWQLRWLATVVSSQPPLLLPACLSPRRAGLGDGGVRVDPSTQLMLLALDSLPFELTAGQKAAFDSVMAQMAGFPPMQCLLQGDVG